MTSSSSLRPCSTYFEKNQNCVRLTHDQQSAWCFATRPCGADYNTMCRGVSDSAEAATSTTTIKESTEAEAITTVPTYPETTTTHLQKTPDIQTTTALTTMRGSTEAETTTYQPQTPLDIKIDEAINSSIIKGYEGRPITVTCTTQGVPSNHALYLAKDDKVMKTGMTPSVMYTFTATIFDNQKEIVCRVKNKKDNYTLRASVRMDLSLKPRVSIVATPNETVRKGNHIGLICQVASDKYGTIEHVLWTHNGQVLQNNTLRLNFQNAGSDIAGVYICTAENKVGKNLASLIVTITCKSLEGNASGTLILAEKDPEDVRFEDGGIYICNVTNGIPDDNNNLWTTGKVEVIVKGKPVMTKPEKHIYTGNFNETSSINIFVLSSSSILAADWFNESDNHLGSKTCFSCTTETDFFGKVVSVTAYKCELLIHNTKEKDFQNYTVQISSEFDKSSFHVSLMAA
ncbi:Hypothetical predicted protein, partial [Mytilus galloprovincialis]